MDDMAGTTESAGATGAPGLRDAAVTHDVAPESQQPNSDVEVQSLPLRSQTNDVATNGNKGDVSTTMEGQPDASVQAQEGSQILAAQDHGVVSNVPPTEVKKKKRKNKIKSAGKRGLDKPDGFEDFFADAPLTPEEYAEEQELYDPKLQFVDRVLTAIARFERTRKLNPERRDILYKYLAYGGLTVGPNVGQGGVDTEAMSKTEIAKALTQVFASDDKRDLNSETSIYDVDFLGCIKGFLSRRCKAVWGLETKDQVVRICTTLERFMDYLLQHDVCPEFKDDILASRTFCRTAATELWDVAEAVRRLPGEFNIACSTLFDGSYAHNYDGETWWGKEDEEGPVFVGMKSDEAHQIVKFGVAGAAAENVYLGFLEGVQNNAPLMLSVINVQKHAGFEITHIEGPTAQCKEIYTAQSTHFRPVGRVKAKPWRNPDALPEDLTDKEREALFLTASSTEADTEYVFFVESILQSMLRVGTKVEATIRTLGCGIMFFDEVLNVYPTFDEFIPNEMMIGWKSPKPLKGAHMTIDAEDGDGGDGDGQGGGMEVGGGVDAAVKGTADQALADVMEKTNITATYKDGDDPY
ncbi:hypothetical protein H2200_002818 [Cladophialophora chaetospira]|uniref:Argonaute complex, subunit Arb1 n=1 Tax=Cladophialophora chaetospira TaxID=386627 RepID=A0AA39CLQ6_9EURO|nr:hypothetical protein H2200_002818 [Cladophialophora chaetospira]